MKAFKLTDLHVEGQVFSVEARINPRAKKLRLRFSRDYKSLIMTLPHHRFEKKAYEFLEQSRGWVLKNLPDPNRLVRIVPGQTIQYLGEEVLLIHKPHSRGFVWEEEEKLIIYGPEEKFENTIEKFFKNKIKVILKDLIETHTQSLNVNYNKLFIRDSQSNWGCCSHKKNLSFSWRLIFTPIEVIDYIAAHEVAHLVEMNHSKKFWLIVKSLCPNYLIYRQWLRQNGKYLL